MCESYDFRAHWASLEAGLGGGPKSQKSCFAILRRERNLEFLESGRPTT